MGKTISPDVSRQLSRFYKRNFSSRAPRTPNLYCSPENTAFSPVFTASYAAASLHLSQVAFDGAALTREIKRGTRIQLVCHRQPSGVAFVTSQRVGFLELNCILAHIFWKCSQRMEFLTRFWAALSQKTYCWVTPLMIWILCNMPLLKEPTDDFKSRPSYPGA